mmetsp:Transcript_12945/g.45306  ORF Transcript_12945/g.45306 Transcript_12945/m.45306 type:complete len:95 (+) Transcript_12945:63-347(+)
MNATSSLLSASYMRRSLGASRADEASSSNTNAGRCKNTRAKPTRCCSPTDSSAAQSHTRSQPPSRSSTYSSPAQRTASTRRCRGMQRSTEGGMG